MTNEGTSRTATLDEASRQCEERYRLLFEDAPVGVGLCRGRRVLLVNRAGARILGASSPEELAGRKLLDLVAPADRAAALAWARQVARGAAGTRVPHELTLRRIDGRACEVTVTARRVLHRGRPALQVLFSDVSERRRLAARLQQAQKMETVGLLAAGAAHDLNNLLSVILSCAGLVLDDLGADSPLRPDVREIRLAGERAAAVARQLLVFSRRDVTRPEVLDLNDLIAHLGKLLRRILGEGVALVTTPAPALWPVKADAAQIEQVLAHLAVDARGAMPDGGKLAIETANVLLDGEAAGPEPSPPPGRYVRLSLRDTRCATGRGWDASALDPPCGGRTNRPSAAFGLAVVRDIVEQAGGDIRLASEPGGATCEIRLPAFEPAAASSTAGGPGVRAGRGETVLLVEDEAAVRGLATRILLRDGYHVLAARDGGEAIRIVQAAQAAASDPSRIDLLLTDVVMPQASGREVAARLRERHPDLKVLYMSGYAENAVIRDRAVEPGASLLEKPFTPEQLLAAVRGILDR